MRQPSYEEFDYAYGAVLMYLKPLSLHQSRRTSSSVNASNTCRRGASNRRCTRTTVLSRVATGFSSREMTLDRVELRLPQAPVRLEPRLRVRERTPA